MYHIQTESGNIVKDSKLESIDNSLVKAKLSIVLKLRILKSRNPFNSKYIKKIYSNKN